jgi:hypothetical protein
MTELLKKDKKFVWTEACERSFHELRACLVQRSQPAFAVGTLKVEPNGLRLRAAFSNAPAFLRWAPTAGDPQLSVALRREHRVIYPPAIGYNVPVRFFFSLVLLSLPQSRTIR